MKTMLEVCDACGRSEHTTLYGHHDLCIQCSMDVSQLIFILHRIHYHKLWDRYHDKLKPALWNEAWLPEKVTA